MSKWISVKNRLPPFDRVVMTCRKSGFNGAPVYAFGSRLSDSEGWIWGVQVGYSGGIVIGHDASWNSIEADDDYQITHWHYLGRAPYRAKRASPTSSVPDHQSDIASHDHGSSPQI